MKAVYKEAENQVYKLILKHHHYGLVEEEGISIIIYVYVSLVGKGLTYFLVRYLHV